VGVGYINRGAGNGSPGDNDEHNREQKVLIHAGKDTFNAQMVTTSEKKFNDAKREGPGAPRGCFCNEF
jgi:hypothetical protein